MENEDTIHRYFVETTGIEPVTLGLQVEIAKALVHVPPIIRNLNNLDSFYISYVELVYPIQSLTVQGW